MNSLFKKGLTLTTLTMLSTLSTFTFAADIGETAKEVGAQVNLITDLMVIGATLLGIVFLIIGGVNLKKHGDNPQQVPLAKPLIFLGAGALLFGLGSTSTVMQETLFGTESRDTNVNSGTFDNFGS